jgi:hypothetical protein
MVGVIRNGSSNEREDEMSEIDEARAVYRENAVKLMSVVLCKIAGMSPIDEADGSPNYWVFTKDAEKIVDDLIVRFPIPEVVLLETWKEANATKERMT